jgi:hypothetical protein
MKKLLRNLTPSDNTSCYYIITEEEENFVCKNKFFSSQFLKQNLAFKLQENEQDSQFFWSRKNMATLFFLHFPNFEEKFVNFYIFQQIHHIKSSKKILPIQNFNFYHEIMFLS